ncbi:hypothetical protein [Nonomuraea rubra]|uniref:PD-(D/E)XK nuclease domain-containing protein n=1 Tax=Nonomuraea rubra TaxID=46180 RepID=UPI0033F0CC32
MRCRTKPETTEKPYFVDWPKRTERGTRKPWPSSHPTTSKSSARSTREDSRPTRSNTFCRQDSNSTRCSQNWPPKERSPSGFTRSGLHFLRHCPSRSKSCVTPQHRPGEGAGILVALDGLEDVFRRLPIAVAVLRQEVRGRPGLTVKDEYDLQRIVHAVLCLHHLDVRPEEYGPSMAGGHPRLDFLLKNERVAVETKMTRTSLGPRKLGDELAQDILRYRAHDHADAYFALVYDPAKYVLNASGFEQDFRADTSFPVRVVIVQ